MKNYPNWLPARLPIGFFYEKIRKTLFKMHLWRDVPCACWYGFDKRPAEVSSDPLEKNNTWYRLARYSYVYERIYYNLENALRVNSNVKGFAFVFFMGVGDYLYTTPLWKCLKEKFPHIPFYGYVSSSLDVNNSPLVKSLLAENPHFEKIFSFQGRPHPSWWKNYDYTDLFKQVPEGFLIVPVFYEYEDVGQLHRVNNVFDVFNVPVPSQRPRPSLDFSTQNLSHVQKTLDTVRTQSKDKKGIVFLQLDGRSTNYSYPYTRQLALELIKQNFLVISVSHAEIDDPSYIEWDIKKFSFPDTFALLVSLKKEFPVYVLCVNSVFFAASAGLDTPSLCLQQWHEPQLHLFWYPNITIVTNHLYSKLPQEKQFLAEKKYCHPHWDFSKGFLRALYCRIFRCNIDYDPSFVASCFTKMIAANQMNFSSSFMHEGEK